MGKVTFAGSKMPGDTTQELILEYEEDGVTPKRSILLGESGEMSAEEKEKLEPYFILEGGSSSSASKEKEAESKES